MARNHQPDDRDELDVGVIERVRKEEKIQEPRQYRVVLHNDDFTPIDFVISLVQAVFRKDEAEATRITFEVHEKGAAIAGVYTHEIAETKVVQVLSRARLSDHPLMASLEPER